MHQEVLILQGFDKSGLWADIEEQRLKCGDDTMYSIKVDNGELKVIFEEGWAEYVEKDETFAQAVQTATGKLAKARPPSKGIGKGKGGKQPH